MQDEYVASLPSNRVLDGHDVIDVEHYTEVQKWGLGVLVKLFLERTIKVNPSQLQATVNEPQPKVLSLQTVQVKSN